MRRRLPTPGSPLFLPPPKGSASFAPSFALSLTLPSSFPFTLPIGPEPLSLSLSLLPLLEPFMRFFAPLTPLKASGASVARPAPAARPLPPLRLGAPRLLLFDASVCTVSFATRPIAAPMTSPTSFAMDSLRNLSFPKGWLPRRFFYLNMVYRLQEVCQLRRFAIRRRGGRGLVVEPEPVEVTARHEVQQVVVVGPDRVRAVRVADARLRDHVLGPRQVGHLEPRLVAPVERAPDVVRVRDARVQRRDPESVGDELQDRLEPVERVLDVIAPHPGRYRDRRDAEAHQPVVLVDVGVVALIGDARRSDMVEEPAPLVVGDEQRAALELRRLHERVDDVGHERLTGA